MSISRVFCAVLIVSASASGQNPKAGSARWAELTNIDSFAKKVDQFIKGNQKTLRIFANVSSGTSSAPDQWREFKSEDERQNADTGENLNENANVWLHAGKVVGATFTFQSPSRDWAQLVMYYFREDGTLAKIQSRLNTFYGDMTVTREKFYGANGRLLRTTKTCFDLKSQKPKVCAGFTDESIPAFRSVQTLPFYKFL
jgi:hypothetical protein